jgi:hypothetical protein
MIQKAANSLRFANYPKRFHSQGGWWLIELARARPQSAQCAPFHLCWLASPFLVKLTDTAQQLSALVLRVEFPAGFCFHP